MKKLRLLILFLFPIIVFGQSESNVFQHYDTIYNSGCGPYKLIIHRPISSDTALRPVIIFMPGQGQQGTSDTTIITQYGPFYWMHHGWDGGVQMGNGKHYPIIISVSTTTTNQPYAPCTYEVLNYIISHYPIKKNSVYVTGFSQGAFSWGSMIKFEQTAGAESGMKLIKAAALFEGEPDPLPAPYNGWDRDTVAYKVWAKKYGGKYFTLEGNGSDNFRNTWIYSGAMNDSVPGSAYFSWENLGGGAHCCWNSMYDPSATNWSCITPFGPNNALGPATNTMGTYRVGQNVWQWMFAQGDTSMVGIPSCTPTVSAGSDQGITLPISTVNLTGTSSALCGHNISSNLWSEQSGPNTATITTPNNLSTNVTGLIQGVYVFKLTTTDNTSATNSATMQVTVNPQVTSYKTYIWPITNTNINITNANVGFTLKGGDKVMILPRTGDYRTYSMSNIGTIGDSLDIQVIFTTGAKIASSAVNIFGNTMDSCNHVHIYGLNMSNHSDPVMFTYANLGHSHFITWDSCTFKNQPGMFSSSTPSMTNVPKLDTTNQYDTVNTFYKWRWHNCKFDSISYNGLTSIWLNGVTTNPPLNQVWMFPEIDSCFFNNYSSSAQPSTYINATACFGGKIHDNTFSNLGVGPVYVGHANSIFSKYCLLYIYRNHFGDKNFGNDARCRGDGTIKQFEWLLRRENPLYNRRSLYCFNWITHKVKYPAFELGVNPSDSSLKWYIPAPSPMVFNNTMWRPAMGLHYDPYHNSLADSYGAPWDSLFVKNNIEIGPNMDTTAWNFTTIGSAGPAVSGLLITFTNGSNLRRIDTASNMIFANWPVSGYSDSVSFLPTLSGLLYNKGVNTGIPIGIPGITDQDYNHNPYPIVGRSTGSGIDVGAFQLPLPGLTPTTNGIQLKVGHKRKFIRI